MSTENYSFFDSVTKSFDKAAKFTQWDPGILEQIKACNSIYSMRFPVKIGDNIEVIEAYRVQQRRRGRHRCRTPSRAQIGRAHV